MDLHVKVVAAFHIVLGILGVMGSLMVALLFGGAAGIIRMAATDANPRPSSRCRLWAWWVACWCW